MIDGAVFVFIGMLLSGEEAAIDNEGCAGGEFRGVRCQIKNGRGDLVGRQCARPDEET
jgi:hypothetical protein